MAFELGLIILMRTDQGGNFPKMKTRYKLNFNSLFTLINYKITLIYRKNKKIKKKFLFEYLIFF